VALTPTWTATGAIEHLRQRIASDTAYATTERTVDAVRAGALGRLGAHRIQLNVRNDEYSDFGPSTTYYAGYGHAVGAHLKLFISASSAFNAPTFNDLFFPFGGNPGLKPEKARSTEVGLQYGKGGTRLRTALFATRYRDLIGNDSAFNRVNVSRASVEGAELTLETFVASVRAVASATLQDARDDVADVRLVRRARAFGNLQLTRGFGPVGVELNWRVTGDRSDRSGATLVRLGGYGLLDLAARWEISRHAVLQVRASNVFDKTYENAFGYSGTPRGVFAGVEARL
jgi:vitamin B12 transporter